MEKKEDKKGVDRAEKSNENSNRELKDDQVEKISGGAGGRCNGCGAPLGTPHYPGCLLG